METIFCIFMVTYGSEVAGAIVVRIPDKKRVTQLDQKLYICYIHGFC